ncbi:MAG: ABC transporter ATP-binding protein [bacterium]
MKMIIELKELTKIYFMGEVKVNALDDVSLTVKKGEFVSIMGPSGSGKTTLLNIIGCIDRPTSGHVMISGTDVTAMSERELDILRLHKIGFVFQRINLIPILSAAENVELPMEIAGVPPGERQKRTAELLRSVGLAHRANHRPGQMSAGEQQRVGIARAIANQPDILLADEPTGNLDSKTSLEIITLLRRLNTDYGQSIILVTHNAEIGESAHRTIHIKDGKII